MGISAEKNMPAKAKLKYIKSLQLKKYRTQEQCFVVEGAKSVAELLNSDFEITLVAATEEFAKQFEQQLLSRKVEVIPAHERELSSVGSLQTNSAAIAVAKMKHFPPPVVSPRDLVLALDNIRDPGNVGTILRTADWFGVTTVVASEETADFYNAKTIGATMGSFCRVRVHYVSLPDFLANVPVIFGTFLEGEDIHGISGVAGGVIVIGNEANGISAEVARRVTHRVTIPKYGNAESLNAAMATAIVLDNLRRSQK
jgi:TrmH family RNA methyltransferase